MGDKQPESPTGKTSKIWRARRAALRASTGFNMGVVGAWFVEPLGGWMKGTNQYYAQMLNFSGLLGRLMLPPQVWTFIGVLKGKIEQAHAKANGAAA